MSERIHRSVYETPIIDVHEHHMPEGLHNRNVGLMDLLEQSYAGWAHARAFPVDAPTGPTLQRTGPSSWEHVARFVNDCGSCTFVRNMVRALSELYHLGQDGITEQNWQDLDRSIRLRHADSRWNDEVLGLAGIERIITDPYCNPLLDVRKTLGERYQSVLRINAFVFGWHPEARDHNGNSGRELLARLNVKTETFDDYLAGLTTAMDTLADRNQVALKSALAYDRSVNFDDPDVKLARLAWNNPNPSPSEQKAFGDVVMDRLCSLAGERDVPVQMHLGLGLIRGSHPLNAAGLIQRHPKTRFLLMHLAYPWNDDLWGLAFTYPNIWIDLTWSWLLSPTRFKRALHEAIEILPDESRLMLGGDNWHVEETYGTLTSVRSHLAEVLTEKVRSGYFREADAERLARGILHDNAVRFFRMDR